MGFNGNSIEECGSNNGTSATGSSNSSWPSSFHRMMGIGLGDPPRIQHGYEKWSIHTEVTQKKVGFSSAFHKPPPKKM